MATMEGPTSAMPVKNTFIHFHSAAAPCVDGRRRALKRWETDPDAMPMPSAPPAEQPAIVEEAASRVCSTPERSPRSWSSSDTATPLDSPTGEHAFSTPEPSPRGGSWSTWCETPAAASGYCASTPPSWASTVVPPWPQQQAAVPLALDRQIPSLPKWLEGPDAVAAAVTAMPGVFGFLFTLRRADDVGLGLDVDCGQSGRVLLVRKVLRGGAIEAWNRQCLKGPLAKKAVMPGDAIVMINGRGDAESMLQECRDSFLLKIFVTRWDPEHVYGGAPSAAPSQRVVPARASCGAGGKAAGGKASPAARAAHNPARLEAKMPTA